MVVVMKGDAAPSDIDAVVTVVSEAGGSAFVSRGVTRTIVGLVGDIALFQTLNLGALQDNGGPTPTHALLSGSVAIDRGHSGSAIADQRGSLRPVDLPEVANAAGSNGSDIGAFELPLPPPPSLPCGRPSSHPRHPPCSRCGSDARLGRGPTGKKGGISPNLGAANPR